MSQLKMIFNAATSVLPKLVIPSGFRLRTIENDEAERYSALRISVGFSAWEPKQLLAYRKKSLPNGLLLIEEISTGRFAASAGAETTEIPALPKLGVIGWVMTHPDFQGRHLGRMVSVAAMHRLYCAECRVFSLLTDDFRLPALVTYLAIGWKPWLYEDDMESRWRLIAKQLGRDFEDLSAYPPHPEFLGNMQILGM